MESEDEIVNIPKTMERFFGCSGTMLKPSPSTVAALIKKIPKGQLTTLDAPLQKTGEELQDRRGVSLHHREIVMFGGGKIG